MKCKLLNKLTYLYLIKKNKVKLARRLGVTVGENCRLMSFPKFGSEPYLIEIGDHVTISSEVAFVNHDGGTWVFCEQDRYKHVIKFGRIKIGNNCFIGMRITILPGVNIGDDCVVGACSLVTKSIPAGEVWGVPAHFISKTKDYAERALSATPCYDIANFNKSKQEELERIFPT